MIAFPNRLAADTVSPYLADDPERLGDEIARLAANIHAAIYRLLVLIRVFDEREGWGWGFRSCAEWLSWRTGIAPGAAREKVRTARALGFLPLISGAMARGELSYSMVRALTRVATPENEAEVLELARHATAAHVERLVRGWRLVNRLESAEEAVEAEAERHRSRFLRIFPDADGSWTIKGRLDPEVGALLEKALEWAGEALYRRELVEKEAMGAEAETEIDARDRDVTHEQRWADAMGLLAERALAGQEREHTPSGAEPDEETADDPQPQVAKDSGVPVSRAERFQVVIHVTEGGAPSVEDEEASEMTPFCDRDVSPGTFGVSAGTSPLHVSAGTSGISLSPSTANRIACDADLVHMSHDFQGRVLDVGRKRRTVPPSLRRALDFRDGGCRFPGCGCRYTDAHHIVHWAEGGETKLDNLTSLCRRHHRAVHEEGFRVELEGDGGKEVRFYRPDGQPFPEVPETPALPAAPARYLVRGNQSQGVDPGPWTPTPQWHGEELDLGLAIDMFRGLEESGRESD